MQVDQVGDKPIEEPNTKSRFGLRNDVKYDKSQQKKKQLRARKRIVPHPIAQTKSSILNKRMFTESNLTRNENIQDDHMEIDQINSKCAKKSPSAVAAKAPDQVSPGKDNDASEIQLNKLTLNEPRQQQNQAAEPEIQRKLRYQIEFYFGNSNLSKDKYLADLIHKDKSDCPYNCVNITDLLKFKRIEKIFQKDYFFANRQSDEKVELSKKESKKYNNNQTYKSLSNIQKAQIQIVVAALKKSYVVKVCSNLWQIKRRVPFNPTKEMLAQIEECTVYVEGFDYLEQETKQEQLIERYFKSYKVRDVRIPVDNKGLSRGHAFVEFDSTKTVDMVISEYNQVNRQDKDKELGFAIVDENKNNDIQVLRKSEYLQSKIELRQIKTELKSLKMIEATKDMMKDDGEENSPDSPQDSFVKLMFTREHFKTSSDLKDFIIRVSEVSPHYIDLQKKNMQAILRFKQRVQAEYCVKQILNAKWGQASSKQGKLVNHLTEGTVEFTTAMISKVIDKVDMLSVEEVESYMQYIQKNRQKYKAHLDKVKKWKKNKNKKQGGK